MKGLAISGKQIKREAGIGRDEFAELFDDYAPVLYAWCVKRSGDPDLAQELVAETFATAWAERSRFRPSAAEDAEGRWLAGIAQNLMRRHWRGQGIETRARKRLGMRSERLTSPEQEQIDERVAAAQSAELLTEQLALLSPAQREAIELVLIDELSYAECAQRSGVAEATVRQRVSRGLRTLRSGLNGGANESA